MISNFSILLGPLCCFAQTGCWNHPMALHLGLRPTYVARVQSQTMAESVAGRTEGTQWSSESRPYLVLAADIAGFEFIYSFEPPFRTSLSRDSFLLLPPIRMFLIRLCLELIIISVPWLEIKTNEKRRGTPTYSDGDCRSEYPEGGNMINDNSAALLFPSNVWKNT